MLILLQENLQESVYATMSDRKETIRNLKEVGYPNNILKCWDLVSTKSKQSTAERLLNSMLADIPPLEQAILDLRYKKFLTLNQIALEIGVPCHIVRARKSEILRKIRFNKKGIELYRYLRAEDK